jgi:anti-sigma-K factor RskA
MTDAGAHDQLAERAELYVLGALGPFERQQFEAHLADCAQCAVEVRSLMPIIEVLAQATPPAEPAPEVRQRLLRRLAPVNPAVADVRAGSVRPAGRLAWLAAAASLAVAVGLGAYSAQLRDRVSELQVRLREATARALDGERQLAAERQGANYARLRLAVLVAPDVARINLAGQPVAPNASARAFWSRSRGLVFTASNLPALPAGRTYQLWVLSAQPAPTSVGLMTPDANGGVNTMFATPADLPTPVAMAVTLEPDGGVLAPTGDKYLVGLAH